MHAINFPVASSYLHCKSVSLNEWVHIFGGQNGRIPKKILVLSALGVPLDFYPKLIIEIFRWKNQKLISSKCLNERMNYLSKSFNRKQ